MVLTVYFLLLFFYLALSFDISIFYVKQYFLSASCRKILKWQIDIILQLSKKKSYWSSKQVKETERAQNIILIDKYIFILNVGKYRKKKKLEDTAKRSRFRTDSNAIEINIENYQVSTEGRGLCTVNFK